jgi:hypothetical protein
LSKPTPKPKPQYQPPALIELGTLQELTLFCDKRLNGSDGFTFMNQPIVCRSS